MLDNFDSPRILLYIKTKANNFEPEMTTKSIQQMKGCFWIAISDNDK